MNRNTPAKSKTPGSAGRARLIPENTISPLSQYSFFTASPSLSATIQPGNYPVHYHDRSETKASEIT
jgi:hypothetical protein